MPDQAEPRTPSDTLTSSVMPSDAAAAPSRPVTSAVQNRKPAKPDAQGWWWGTGRRKTAVARVRIRPGSGKIEILIDKKRTKTIDEYFTEERDRNDALAPLKATNTLGKVDVSMRLHGGGFMGQAGAVMLGVARALKNYDPGLEPILRDNRFLTRDPREVERKKYGQAGARRRFQFSKR